MTGDSPAGQALKDIEPKSHARVMDLVRDAGVNVDSWVIFAKALTRLALQVTQSIVTNGRSLKRERWLSLIFGMTPCGSKAIP